MSKIRCTVEIIVSPEDVWVTVLLQDGRLDNGTRLICSETGDAYRVDNFGFNGWRSMAAGYRTVLLSPIDPSRPTSPLAPGMHLVG